MKKFLIVSVMGLAVVISAFADDHKQKVEEPVESAEVKADKAVTEIDVAALITECAACHGKDGNSAVATNPKLAGQNARYLLKQLKDVQSGKRKIAVMSGLLDAFNDAQLSAIATFYSEQETTMSQANDQYLALGESIYRIGNAQKGLPACTGCHSPSGKGNAEAGFPSLGGQHAAYISSSLRSFREGSEYVEKGRRNDEMQGVMRGIAIKMSDKEIEAVSNYISGLYAE